MRCRPKHLDTVFLRCPVLMLLLPALLLLTSIGAFGSLNLTVRDSSTGDDIAHVILFYPDASQLDLGYTPLGVIGRTWDLLTESQILTKGAGTYTLRIIHDEDFGAPCNPPNCEVRGTYDITFGGGIVVSAVSENATVTAGQPVTINVLDNDLLVNALAFSFGTIPCPLTFPDPTCACSTYGSGTQCPSGLEEGVNYVQGQFTVTVGDPSLSILFVSSPPHGTATIVGDSILYTPNPGYCGLETFTYTAQRSGAIPDTGTVTVAVAAAPPVAQNDLATTLEGMPIVIDVLQNDTTAGNGPLSLGSVGSPSHGSAMIVGDTIRYVPQTRFEGLDRFTYTARNACGGVDEASVEVSVIHANHPPTASAGGVYQGFVGEPMELNAGFSTDSDITDTLQFRWDLDEDGQFDTDWLSDPAYSATFASAFVGRVMVEVRDIYRGQPTGDMDRATALVRIEQRQPELRGVLFVDFDGDGLPGEGDPPLPKIQLALDSEMYAITGDDGQAIFSNLAAGQHTVTITPDGLALLQLQGFGVDLRSPSITLDIQSGPPTVALFPIRSIVGSLAGLIYIDTDGSGEREQGEPAVPDLTVSLREGLTRTTNQAGRFLFMNVTAGEYVLTITSAQHQWQDLIGIESGESTDILIAWPSPDSGFLEVKIQPDQLSSEEEE